MHYPLIGRSRIRSLEEALLGADNQSGCHDIVKLGDRCVPEESNTGNCSCSCLRFGHRKDGSRSGKRRIATATETAIADATAIAIATATATAAVVDRKLVHNCIEKLRRQSAALDTLPVGDTMVEQE